MVTFKEAILNCCLILNNSDHPGWASTRWPAVYKTGGITIRQERPGFNVSVDADTYIQNGRLGWKVRVSCNAAQLSHDKALEFSKLYLEAVRVAGLAQTYMDSVEIDLKSLSDI